MPDVFAEAIEPKDVVYTPDGKGIVTGINERLVSVDLENGTKASYSHNEIFSDEEKKVPAVVVPPPPAPSAPSTPPMPVDDSAPINDGRHPERIPAQ